MIIYVLMFFLSTVFAFLAQRYAVKRTDPDGNTTYKLNKFFVIASAIVPIFFAGMRSFVADSTAYINSFNNITWQKVSDAIFLIKGTKEPGFLFLEWLFKQVIDNYTVWFFAVAFFSVFCLWKTYTRYSDSFSLSVYLFYGTTTFYWLFNGMRQFIAICAMFLMFPLLLKTDNLKRNRIRLFVFIVMSLLLFTIHSSAIVVLPLFLFCRAKLFGRWKALFVLLFSLAFSFIGPINSFFTEMFDDPTFGNVANDIEMSEGANILRLVVAAIPVFLGLYRIRQIKYDNDPVLNFSFNMSLMNACIWVPAVIISGNVFGRFADYCSVFNLILYPMLLQRYYYGKTRKLIKLTMIFAFAFWFYYQMAVTWGSSYFSQIIGNFY